MSRSSLCALINILCLAFSGPTWTSWATRTQRGQRRSSKDVKKKKKKNHSGPYVVCAVDGDCASELVFEVICSPNHSLIASVPTFSCSIVQAYHESLGFWN